MRLFHQHRWTVVKVDRREHPLAETFRRATSIRNLHPEDLKDDVLVIYRCATCGREKVERS